MKVRFEEGEKFRQFHKEIYIKNSMVVYEDGKPNRPLGVKVLTILLSRLTPASKLSVVEMWGNNE
ncbi:MAG: hypothetical protein H3Z52_15690 [archaeon]|nr:hypothetical protein [archaeon]